MDLEWLDDQCERYESNWTIDQSGPDAVVAFALVSLQPGDSRLPILLGALIEVDIDRIWMKWRTNVSKHREENSPAIWCERLASVPKLADYVAAVTRRNIDFEVSESLLKKEYDARQAWGDAPRWETVTAPWPNGALQPCKPARHRVELQSSEFPIPKVFDLCGLTIFGRQRTTDEAFGVIVHETSGSRIIVANRDDAMISRRLFSLQILSANQAVITNLSLTNPLPLNSTTVLESEVDALVELPFAFRIQELRLRFS
jgi:hypothetical protein